jgi:hypothetical protein
MELHRISDTSAPILCRIEEFVGRSFHFQWLLIKRAAPAASGRYKTLSLFTFGPPQAHHLKHNRCTAFVILANLKCEGNVAACALLSGSMKKR